MLFLHWSPDMGRTDVAEPRDRATLTLETPHCGNPIKSIRNAVRKKEAVDQEVGADRTGDAGWMSRQSAAHID